MACNHKYTDTPNDSIQCIHCGKKYPKESGKSKKLIIISIGLIIGVTLLVMNFTDGTVNMPSEEQDPTPMYDVSISNSSQDMIPQEPHSVEPVIEPVIEDTIDPVIESSIDPITEAIPPNKPAIPPNPKVLPENITNYTITTPPHQPEKINHTTLIALALNQINQDRADWNAPPVKLSNNTAAQVHAQDNLNNRAISHWLSNGEKPYMTYSRLNGTGHVSQNVAYSGYEDVSKCKGGGCMPINVTGAMISAQHSMMYDDAHADWGHRDNIINPFNTHVSIGIAHDEYTVSYVQNFESIHVELESVLIQDTKFRVIGMVLGEYGLTHFNVYYDGLPNSDTYEEFQHSTSYSGGELIASVQRPLSDNWRYGNTVGYELVVADNWSANTGVVWTDFDLWSVVDKDGVYTVIMWVEDYNTGDSIAGASKSYKFVGGEYVPWV